MRRPYLAIALALSTLGVANAAGQELPREIQDREPQDTARQDTIPRDTATQDTLRSAGPALGYHPAPFGLAATVGSPGGGEVQTQPVHATRRNLSGVVLDSTMLSRVLSLRGGFHGALSATVGLGPAWGLKVALGIATATLEAGYTGDDETFVASAQAVAATSAKLEAVSVESALQYRIPSTRRVRPYLELGVMVSRWTAEGALAAPTGLASGVTRFEATAGLGGVVPLNEGLSVRLVASTRLLRTPVHPAPVGDTLGTSSALVLVARPPSASSFADDAREMLGLLRFEVGLSLDLGRPPAPTPPVEASDTLSSPARSPGPGL